MEVIIQPGAEAATRVAAKIFADTIRHNPSAVLGLATGHTPLQLYRQLVEMNLDWSRITTFNLDEYVGIPPEHPQSYHAFMREHLLRHINICPENVNIPDGMASDIPASCERYERKIVAAGGIDLQLLGLGTDGHIAFNEPTSSLASRTRIKTLTRQTRKDNAVYFGSLEAVPFHVITMGIGTILEARHCVLLAFGSKKARAIAGAVEGPVSSMNPAATLQMHPKVTVCLDEEAAAKLKQKDYYIWALENKPDWEKS
jgi:glucosamine-6-phosphate deaminase